VQEMVLRLSKKSPKWTFLCREPGAQPGGGAFVPPEIVKTSHRILAFPETFKE